MGSSTRGQGGRRAEEDQPALSAAAFQAQLRNMSPPDLLALVKKQTHELYELDMHILNNTEMQYLGTPTSRTRLARFFGPFSLYRPAPTWTRPLSCYSSAFQSLNTLPIRCRVGLRLLDGNL